MILPGSDLYAAFQYFPSVVMACGEGVGQKDEKQCGFIRRAHPASKQASGSRRQAWAIQLCRSPAGCLRLHLQVCGLFWAMLSL